MSETTNSPIGLGIEVRADLDPGDAGLWEFWTGQERIAEREEGEWRKRALRVLDRYRDKRDQTGKENAVRRFNILWSNVQTLKPVLYARRPKPEVKRRFLDKDPVGRLASLLLERALSYSLEIYDFDAIMEACVEDRLLPGRGVARVLYVPHYGDVIEDGIEEPTGENYRDVGQAPATIAGPGDRGASLPPNEVQAVPAKSRAEPLREVVYDEVCVKYVYWGDYREAPARSWDEMPWIRFQVFMTRKALCVRFGRKKGNAVQLDTVNGKDIDKAAKNSRPVPDIFKKARVYEFWDKENRRVIWLAPGTPDLILDELDDPLELPEFFPVPSPLLATTTTDKRTPIPDYTEYQDQANELDLLTARIDRLTRALKVSGVYAASEKDTITQLLDDNTENKLIPVTDWAQFAGAKGGLEGSVLWFPIKQVADVLIQLCDMRDRSKQIIYEITGIGDIIRGATVPDETATAQRLKANFATRRQVPEQKRVARFARDIIRLMAGVIAGHFSAQTISAITGYPELAEVPELGPMPPQFLPGAMGAPQAPPAAPMPGGNVVPGPGMQGQPGMQAPPQPQNNPEWEKWQKANAERAMVIAENAAKQSQFDAAVALIKADGVTGFRLDIESDSTIAVDDSQERQDANEFLGAILPLLQQLLPLVQGNPPMAQLAKQLVMLGVRRYQVARQVEDAIEEAFDAMAKMPPPPAKDGGKAAPNPEIEKAKIAADVHDTQAKTAAATHDTDTKAQVALATLGQKAQQAQGQERIAAMKAETEQQHGLVELAIQASEAENRQQVARTGAAQKAAGDVA